MLIYCVYLTCYSGNKLPPFYIGHSSTKKIEEGYNGSVSSIKYKNIWNSERRLFPEKFKTKVLFTFSRRLEASEKEEKLQKLLSVHKNPLYINRAIGYYKFYNDSFSEEHKRRLSASAKKKILSEEHKKNISKSGKGIKKRSQTLVHKKNLSMAHLGKKQTAEHIEKRRKQVTGRKRSAETKNLMSSIRRGFKVSDETKRKISETLKNKSKHT